jgi:hypothetical protein
MTLKCTVDGRAEDLNHVIFVCHHCGRPVCEQHGLVVPADDAFAASGEEPDRRTLQSAAQAVKHPQAAMHCKQCAEKEHRGVRAHPGWTDPRTVPRPAPAQPRAAQPAVAGQQQPQAPWPGQPGQQQPDQQQGRATGRP